MQILQQLDVPSRRLQLPRPFLLFEILIEESYAVLVPDTAEAAAEAPAFRMLREAGEVVPKTVPGTNCEYSEEDLAELKWEREFWLEAKARERAYDGPVVKQARR